MTDAREGVVVPYSRFLEFQDRRRPVAAEPSPTDRPPTTDALPAAVAVEVASAQPLTAHEG